MKEMKYKNIDVFKDIVNIHEWEKARRMAASLGMKFIEKLDWNEEPEVLGVGKAKVSLLTRKNFLKEKKKPFVPAQIISPTIKLLTVIGAASIPS